MEWEVKAAAGITGPWLRHPGKLVNSRPDSSQTGEAGVALLALGGNGDSRALCGFGSNSRVRRRKDSGII